MAKPPLCGTALAALQTRTVREEGHGQRSRVGLALGDAGLQADLAVDVSGAPGRLQRGFQKEVGGPGTPRPRPNWLRPGGPCAGLFGKHGVLKTR